MIIVDKAFKKFGTKVVLNDLDLVIPEGKVFGLIGPSGSGKSVLSKSIAGLLKLDKGSILIDGIQAQESKSVGYVFQFGGLFDSLTLMENILFVPKINGALTRELCERAISICESLKISKYLNTQPKNMPLTARKLGALVRALMADVKWIFIDEPDSGLDPENVQNLYRVILDANRDRSKNIVVVSHDVPDVFYICDHYALIFGGKIVSEGRIEEGKIVGGDDYVNQFVMGLEDGPICLN